MFDLENEDQGHGVQHSQWSHSMANISTIVKVILKHFSLVLTVFKLLTFQNVWHWSCWSRSWCTTFAVVPFNGKYLNLQTYYHPLTSPNMFLSLLTYIIIHWTSLSLLLTQISLQQYHKHHCIWSLFYFHSPQLYTHTSPTPFWIYLPSHQKH